MAGEADSYIVALRDVGGGNGFGDIATMAAEHAKKYAFDRGFRNCVQGNTFDTGWSIDRQRGYKAAQALGLFNVWP